MLEIKSLYKKFDNNSVLKSINLKVEKGDIVAIIGPSGCGKSTLLRCINMLEKPTSGNVIFEGVDLTDNKIDLPNIRKKMGMVFQQFNLFPHLTVLDNMTLAPIKLCVMTKDEANERALDILKSIGLKNKQNSYPGELSGGQKQRVAIGRALMMDPDIMLFDEPTSALDPEMVGEVLELIEKLANNGMTMIIVSHEMNFVKKCANKVVFLDDGKVSYFGSVKEVFNNNGNERLVNFLSKTNK